MSHLDDLRIRAGEKAYAIIMDGGFTFDSIRVYVGPAVGPRWLIAAGFDLSLIREKLLGKKNPLLLAGASAGAWRFSAWIQPECEKKYQLLLKEYISFKYEHEDNPTSVQRNMYSLINTVLDDDALSFAINNQFYRLAVITARTKSILSLESNIALRFGFLLCYLLNAINQRLMKFFFEPVVFYTGVIPPKFTFKKEFQGTVVPLTEINFKDALVASGAIPMVVRGVKDIFGAPRGMYRDGGLTDYHLARQYSTGDHEITLLFLHQGRIIPTWLDKTLKNRFPSGEALENLLLVYPSPELIARLPMKKVPDRDDFLTFIDNPEKRIEYWEKAADMCSHLGDLFLEVTLSPRLKKHVKLLKYKKN
ncbi:MAG: hypothetical protein N2317_06455 [Syntrophales bacterium]|nr:hypothetical protein [Syntrophales bacterium]